MKRSAVELRPGRRIFVSALAFSAAIAAPPAALADEGGVSFWVPGFFGSLAATPLQPGFSAAYIYYHTSLKAGGDVAAARQVTRGNFTAPVNLNLNLSLSADVNLGMWAPQYTFATPFLGGQATVALLVAYGRATGTVDGTLTASVGPIGFTIGGSRTDTLWAFGDLGPMFNVRWNHGVHNWMTYVTGNLTVGAYDPTRLANLGMGHNAIDVGGGYTYFNPQTGMEFSAVVGLTYNLLNEHTQYQKGID